jgi:hypothetical protein
MLSFASNGLAARPTRGLVAAVNMRGVVISGESVTLEASNPGPAVRLDIATLTVGGNEGVSGNVAGPDTITVGRTFTIPPARPN